MVEGWCWFCQVNVFHENFPCWTDVLLFPANFMSSTYTDKNNPLSINEKKTFPVWELLPKSFWIELSIIAVPAEVLPKDDRTDSVQEEQLGLPHWTMILAICVVVEESNCLDTPIWEFSIICEHLPFLLGCKPILHLLLVHRNQAIWKWYPWSYLLSFVMLMILVQWILHKIQNHLQQNHLGGTTRPLYFWCFASNSAFFKWHVSISDAKWTVAPFVLTSSITSFLLLTFVRFHAEIFSNFAHSLSTAAFAARIFMAWSIGINLWTKL